MEYRWRTGGYITGFKSLMPLLGREKGFRTSIVITFFLAASAVLAFSQGTNAASSSPESVGQKTFKVSCSACHGKDGHGTTIGKKVGAPDLHSPEVQQRKDEELRKQVIEGKANMPSFKSSLSSDEINAVIRIRPQFRKAKSREVKACLARNEVLLIRWSRHPIRQKAFHETQRLSS